MALAYFITFHTYGTWLPGTAKGEGSVDRDHNRFGTPLVSPDLIRELEAHGDMAQPPYILESDGEREVVRDAIVRLCRRRDWRLRALHVRTNHIHSVVVADGDPGRLMSDMKAAASKALTRAGFDDVTRRRWTRHGSTLHLFSNESVAEKIDYTLNQQGNRMACFDGRENE